MVEIEEIEGDLKHLITFVNADIESMGEEEVENLIQELALFHTTDKSEPQMLNFERNYQRIAGPLALGSSEEIVQGKKSFLKSHQMYARSVINSRKALYLANKKDLIIDDQVVMFKVDSSAVSDEMKKLLDLSPLEEENLRFEFRFTELFNAVFQEGLFGKCKKCRQYFFHLKAGKRLFCSEKCSAAFRREKGAALSPEEEVKE